MEYRKSFFRSDNLQKYAKEYLKVLPKDVTCLVSRGSSGCSIASAMLVLSERRLKHWYIRKERERAHEGWDAGFRNKRDIFAIVDDFINSGQTVEKIINYIKKEYGIKNIRCIIVAYNDDYELKRQKNIKIIEIDCTDDNVARFQPNSSSIGLKNTLTDMAL